MDERIQVPVEDSLGVSGLVARPGVLDLLVRMEDIAADPFSAEACVGGPASLLRHHRLPLLLGALDEPGLEDAHRRLLVRGLRALVLALHDDAGRKMRDAYRTVGLVDVLAARSLGAVGVDLEVALVDLDVGVVGKERRDDHGCERRLAAVGGVEGREADEPVLAPLGLQDPVGVLALDGEGRALEARLLAGARLEELDLEAPVGAPALVHPQHHLRPVLGVGAPGARLERHDGVAGVVLAVEERRLLEPLELAAQRPDRCGDLVGHRRVELVELAGVLVLAGEPLVGLELLRDAGVLGARSSAPGPGRPRSRARSWPTSSSARRSLRRAGSKVITDPGKLGPDLLELL